MIRRAAFILLPMIALILFSDCRTWPERSPGEGETVPAIRDVLFSGAYRSIPYFKEAAFEATEPQRVYLWRVERTRILDYDSYEYFTGRSTRGEPTWNRDAAMARPVVGLGTYVQGSAMYHEGTGRYLFLTGAATPLTGIGGPNGIEGALFEAPEPWGPWTRVARLPGGTIATLIPKGAGPAHVFFTAAGGAVDYNLHIGRLDFNGKR